MTPRVLWKLSVKASPEAEEAVAELLAARFGQAASIYTDLASGQTTVTTYLPSKPDWSGIVRAELTGQLKQLTSGARGAVGRVTLSKLPPENWTEAWKRHFKPIDIGARLRIKPSWDRTPARPGQLEVVLDPGMSFGTGQHPTTSFCLAELARQYRAERASSMLDIGTGSGILAIAAAKLGYGPVEATDADPDSIRVARTNARSNGVSQAIRFKCQDLATAPLRRQPQYSVVCANLMADLLQSQRSRVLAGLHPKGLLVLAGILKTEFTQVQQAYESAGLRLVRSRTEKEWRSGSFVRVSN